jgi:hypothetical protein
MWIAALNRVSELAQKKGMQHVNMPRVETKSSIDRVPVLDVLGTHVHLESDLMLAQFETALSMSVAHLPKFVWRCSSASSRIGLLAYDWQRVR